MIVIGVGANLDSEFGSPLETITAAVMLMAAGMDIVQKSRIWKSAPVPYDAAQNWYHNAVIEVETNLSPDALLEALLEIETGFGRVRSVKNAPRVLDLDLIVYGDQIIQNDNLIVPHPRMHERLFVLKPLEDLDKKWIHPVLKRDIHQMIKAVAAGQEIEPLEMTW